MYKNIIPASLLFTFIGAVPAQASNWEVFKYVEAGVVATDNYQLGSDLDELVFSVKPSVELSFTGVRFETDIVAGVEVYQFNERGDNIVDPRLNLSTSGTLVNNLLYVNSSLEVGKVLPEDDFFDLSEDPDTRARFRFNPFISRKFGRFADLYFGFGHQSLDNEADGDVDTQQNTLAFSLGRNPKFGGFIWGFGGAYENDKVGDVKFENTSAYVSLGATLGQSVYFEVLGGAEINDYTENEDLDDDDSAVLWDASLNWTPSDRTAFKVGYGERFYGEGLTFSFKHRVRNSTLSADWTREINSSDVTLSGVSPFSETGDSLIPNSVDLINDNAISRRALFVDKRLRLGYKLAGRRSDLIVDAVYSDQQELDGDATREKVVGRLVLDRHLSPLTTFRIQYEHLISDESANDDNASENRLGVKLLYNFDRKERSSIIEGDSDIE